VDRFSEISLHIFFSHVQKTALLDDVDRKNFTAEFYHLKVESPSFEKAHIHALFQQLSLK